MVSFYVQIFFVLYIIYVNSIYMLFKKLKVKKNLNLIKGKVKAIQWRKTADFTFLISK